MSDGLVGFEDRPPEASLPCCRGCYEGAGFKVWVEASIELLKESPIAFVSSGNLAEDRKTVENYAKHESRIQDGICPNGCAQMVRAEAGDDHNAECPVCKFGYYSNVPLRFPYE